MASRELRPSGGAASSSEAARLQPLEPFVLAPTEEQFAVGDTKLRDRVTGVAIATAVYFVASALIQVLTGLINEKFLERNLRSLAQVQAVPELTWLVDALPSAVLLGAVPVLVVSFLTGCLFATCGVMGSKGNSECCACCYCCCNACYCVSLVLAFIATGIFLQSVAAAGVTAELWFAQCDPKICYPLGFDTKIETTVDCLAPAVWDGYAPRYEGIEHLPEECPPMYLQCGEEDDEGPIEARSLQTAEDFEGPVENFEPAEDVAQETPQETEDERTVTAEPDAEEEVVQETEDAEPQDEGTVAAEPEDAEEEVVQETEDAEPQETEEVVQETEDAEPQETEDEGTVTAEPEDAVEEVVQETEDAEPQETEDAEGLEDSEPEDAEAPKLELEEPGGPAMEPVVGPADEAEEEAEEEPDEEVEEEEGPEGPPEPRSEVLTEEMEPEDWSERSENPLKALAQTVLAVPMPEDPLVECKPSKIVALYKVARREAPSVFEAVWKQTMLRLVAMIPSFVLMSLGFWWGHELWSKLTKGSQPAYVMRLPFGQGAAADVQMTHMSQPLMNQQ